MIAIKICKKMGLEERAFSLEKSCLIFAQKPSEDDVEWILDDCVKMGTKYLLPEFFSFFSRF